MRKLISIVICLAVMLSVVGAFPVMAAENLVRTELLGIGSMETLGTSYGSWDGIGTMNTDYVHSGEKSLKLVGETVDARSPAVAGVGGVIPGETYTVSGWIYMTEKGAKGPWIKVIWVDKYGADFMEQDGPVAYGAPLNEWYFMSADVKAPQGATGIKLHLRMDGIATGYYDDVEITGNVTEQYLKEQEEQAILAAEGRKISDEFVQKDINRDATAQIDADFPNPLYNPSFEEVDETGLGAVGWGKIGEWGQYCFVTDEAAHTGTKSMKITGTSGKNWVRQYVDVAQGQLIPGRQHVMTAWVKYTPIHGSGAFMKMEPNHGGEFSSVAFPFDDEEWHQIKYVVDVTPETTRIGLLFRIHGAGAIYVDDVEFGPGYRAGEIATIRSDIFFYTENEMAKAGVRINNTATPIIEGSVVEFKIKDGDTVLAEAVLPAKRDVEWEYPVMTLAEKKRPYILEAVYKDANGNVIQEMEPWEVYRYDRPKTLTADGTLMVDGKPFYPYIAYETNDQYLELAKEIGINAFRESSSTRNIELLKPELDKIAAAGYKVPIKLYGSIPAGHPSFVMQTRAIVETFKDHPAVLCWMIQDEPTCHYGTGGGQCQTYDEMLYWLKQSYIEIRAIDDVHPVYVLESRGQVEEPYYRTAKTADVFVIDPYAANYEWQLVDYINQCVEEAMASVPEYKPVWALTDTYVQYDHENGTMHTCDDLRHRFYSFALNGVKGLGLYGLTLKDHGKRDMYTAPDGLWEDYKHYFESGEYDEMVEHFLAGKHPVFNEYEVPEYRYHSWVKNGFIYLMIQEMADSGKNTMATIDLTSSNGRVVVNGFTGTVINGSDEKTISGDSNIITVNLKPRQSILYKIKPSVAVEMPDLELAKYDDSALVDWATKEIEFVGLNRIANDIAPNTFAPTQNITRGDFAYFLMNALEIIDTYEAQQFSDVDSSKYYAKAILAGRKAGILNGSGNDMYQPEEAISRQDAMAIIARAMTYKAMLGKSDTNRLAVFSDNALIADYAREPIAAMTEEGVVKGNADGTVNPLGNITRAETAVIVYRILNK
ncbi:MAG: S-layer homology domain-containing protein [Clostridia bacterium]|nr:S-layer homology domain-containing protein [Clostridia bacterium]